MIGPPRAWIADLHPRLRPVLAAMLAAGVALTVLGVAADLAGLWSSLPFLTNLVSALTGALFGIPVAVAVVQRLLQAQTDATDRAAAWRQATRSVHEMRIAAHALSRADGAAADLARHLARCDAALGEAREWADRALTAKPRPRRARASMYQRTYLRQVLALHEAARQALDVYASTGLAAPTAGSTLERIRSEAVFLHHQVRPAVLRLGDPWLPQPQAAAIEQVDDTFPAGLSRTGATRVRAVEQLLAAVPAAQLAALLPEADEARGGLPDPDRPLPLPTVQTLMELRAGLGLLSTQLDRARRITEVVDGIQQAVDDSCRSSRRATTG
ncbi:hypothetical protein GCM10010168_28030 [Actinoplanes ianthinogenes]|uniref:5-bromo-4-chloroindolyl phosphate hydrolysis protein n=1 Tax=Actinoplanes ianthinogenes TaxID=122358 RepID=A0ABM7LL49_9ACTN|nr:hypothetical protein [Actinoplanes ianthinogenes]BCJ39944.1 hypothetical protein Aiant_06010 [Actinoplanes ianthinogenes]GGR09195.1 hypothetical protein GCM10010168_28030 [Actinoplanes ianthinogenes]